MLLNSQVLTNGIWQTQLFQINQSEESSNMIINAHTTSCQSHQQSITSAVHYNRINSIEFCVWAPIVMQLWWCTAQSAYSPRSGHWTLDTAARKTTNLSWRFPRLTSPRLALRRLNISPRLVPGLGPLQGITHSRATSAQWECEMSA